jgi:hypothetical protein
VQQQDRDDDIDDDTTPKKSGTQAEPEIEEPFNMADLKVSMVQMPDDLKQSTDFFEKVLRDQVGGEARFRKAQAIIEKFRGGDIYFNKYEDKLLK